MKAAVRASQTGFSLIEVLVASSIAVASLGVLMNLFASGLDRMARIEHHSQRMIVEKEIVGRLSRQNPAASGTGQDSVGDWSYRWEAKPLGEFKRVSSYFPYDAPRRDVALFRYSVEIAVPDQEKQIHLEFEKVGWR